MTKLFLIGLSLCFFGCSQQQDTTSEPISQPEVADIVDERAPHVILLGDEESITLMDEAFIKDQTALIKQHVAGDASAEEVGSILDGNYAADVVNERIIAYMGNTLSEYLAETIDDAEETSLQGMRPKTHNLLKPKIEFQSPIKITDAVIHAEVNESVAKSTGVVLPELANKRSPAYWFWRIVQKGQGGIQKAKQSDKSYFTKALRKKKVDSSYSKFDAIGEVKFKGKLADKLQLSEVEVADINTAVEGVGSSITLGMLPKKGLLEDVDRNNQARQNIRDHLGEKGFSEADIESRLRSLDALKVKLLASDGDKVQKIREGNETSDADANQLYAWLKNSLGGDLLEQALGSKKIEAEHRIVASWDLEIENNQMTKQEGIDHKNKVQSQLDDLRQTFQLLDAEQINVVRTGSKDPSAFTAEQLAMIERNGGFEALEKNFQSLSNAYGQDVIEALVIPQTIPNYKRSLDNMSMISMVEGFEFEQVVPAVSKSAAKKIIKLPEGRFYFPLAAKDVEAGLGAPVQASVLMTRDRTEMTPEVLDLAVDKIQEAVSKGQSAYVHCKSGKGRSASAVVAAEVDAIIKALNKNRRLSKNDMLLLVGDVITQVKESRPLIGISKPQRENIVNVLAQRQDNRLTGR